MEKRMNRGETIAALGVVGTFLTAGLLALDMLTRRMARLPAMQVHLRRDPGDTEAFWLTAQARASGEVGVEITAVSVTLPRAARLVLPTPMGLPEQRMIDAALDWHVPPPGYQSTTTGMRQGQFVSSTRPAELIERDLRVHVPSDQQRGYLEVVFTVRLQRRWRSERRVAMRAWMPLA